MECLNGTLEVRSVQGVHTEFKIYFEAKLAKSKQNVSAPLQLTYVQKIKRIIKQSNDN